jgi:antitoxin component YwqK of YwqJK toxin-antitoxin module
MINQGNPYVPEPVHTVNKEYRNDGSLSLIDHRVDGILNGPCTTFYPNGNIERDEFYHNGNLDGCTLSYYPSGRFREIINHRAGKLNGPNIHFLPDGEVYIKQNFRKGNPHGTFRSFRKGFEREENWDHGRQQGLSKVWYEDGTLQSHGYYWQHGCIGEHRNWLSNGQPRNSSNYLGDGIRHGLTLHWIDYPLFGPENKKNSKNEVKDVPNNKLCSSRNFIDGEIEGEDIKWHPEGGLGYLSYYINDECWKYDFLPHRRFWLRLRRKLHYKANLRKYGPLVDEFLYPDIAGLTIRFL